MKLLWILFLTIQSAAAHYPIISNGGGGGGWGGGGHPGGGGPSGPGGYEPGQLQPHNYPQSQPVNPIPQPVTPGHAKTHAPKPKHHIYKGYDFQSPKGDRHKLQKIYKGLKDLNPKTDEIHTARVLGIFSVEQADSSFSHQKRGRGEFYKHMAQSFLNIGLGMNPVTGFTQSVYELVYGKNIVTGEILTPFDRKVAVLGIIGVPGVKYLPKGLKHLTHWVHESKKAFQKAGLSRRETKLAIHELRPIVHFLKRHDLTTEQRRSVIQSFSSDSKIVKLTEDKKVYRYYVEGKTNPRKEWVTDTLVENPKRDLALPKPGPYRTQEWIIPKNTEVFIGRAYPRFGEPGGARQIFVPKPKVLR